mgnify:CR=1 FL=1
MLVQHGQGEATIILWEEVKFVKIHPYSLVFSVGEATIILWEEVKFVKIHPYSLVF